MTTPEIPFKRQAVEPVQCIKNGWELIKDQYWLFVGMCFIGRSDRRSSATGNSTWTNDVWSVPDVF